MKPIGTRIVVSPMQKEEMSPGGIVLPDSAREKPEVGVVVAVGRGRHENGTVFPLEVRPGDKVVYAKYAGNELKQDGNTYLVIDGERDVLVVL